MSVVKEKKSYSKKYSGKQKAAILLVTLGPDVSANIFKHLKEEEVEQMTFEIARIDKVNHEDKVMVLEEFQELMMAQDFITQGGLDFARDVLIKALGKDRAQSILDTITSSIRSRPFEFIRKTDPAYLLNFLQSEHPQTIALILSYLEPAKASLIISSLPEDIQADVAKRIATMDRTSPEVIREVERVLERKLSTLASEEFTAAGGVDAIVEVLNLVDRATERNIIEELEDENPELAEEIKKRMFVFEDIILLDDRSVQKVLREVESQELSLALKSVDDEVKDKIYRNMSKRAANLIKEEISFMGPVRIKDVEDAQQKIVGIIRRLEEGGDIHIARIGDEQYV